MDIWNYSPTTGELISQGVADNDPLDPNNWLLPAFSTSIVPPAPQSGSARVFSNGSWSYIEDHRGETWYDVNGSAIKIDALGSIPAGLSASVPPPTVAALHAYAITARYSRISTGITVSGVPIAGDTDTQRVILGAWTSAKLDATYVISSYKLANGAGYVSLTNAQIIGIGEAMRAFIQACFDQNKVVDAAIDAETMTTFAQIDAAYATVTNAF